MNSKESFPSARIFPIALLALAISVFKSNAAQTWQEALKGMPLTTNVTSIDRFNFASTVLDSFQSNDVIKAVVLMPGCTDEFYFFRRGETRLTNSQPTLLDLVTALTNQTVVRVTFKPPLLLLHSADDPLEPMITINDAGMVEKLKKRHFLPHMQFNDLDWDHLQPILYNKLSPNLLSIPHFFPVTNSRDSWHFYRHSLAGWNLNGWEALQALSLAGKTKFTVYRTKIVFAGDTRIGNQQVSDKNSPITPK